MAREVEVTGIAQMLKRLHTVEGETALGMERGLVKAGITLQRLSQQVVPVDTGVLKASAFTAKEGKGFRSNVMVGYSTSYAIFVHENLDAHHAPGKIAKFLEQPMRQNLDKLQKIVRDEAQLGRKGSVPQLAPPLIASHALLPIPPRGKGSAVRQVSGEKVTYVRGRGWRRKK